MTELAAQGFNLSPQQRRLWRLAGASAPRAWARIRIVGDLDRDRLCRAIGRLVARHEILRTEYACPPGMSMPLQMIGAAPDFLLVEEGARRPAAGEVSPPLAVEIETSEPGVHRLRVSLPALSADRFSWREWLAQLASAYAATSDELEPGVEILQYADLSEWQNELLAGPDGARARAFWGRSAGLESREAPRLAWARAAGAEPFAPAEVVLDPASSAALSSLSRRLDASLEAVAYASWQTLLWRLLDGEPAVVAASFDGRKYEEMARALGPFERLLPVAVEPAPDLPFAELARRAGEALETAAKWQEFFAGEEAGFPPFAFFFEREPGPVAAGPLRFAIEEAGGEVDRFDLALRLREQTEGPELRVAFDPAVYRAFEADLVGRQLGVFLSVVAAASEIGLSRLSLCGDAEARLTAERNATHRDRSGEALLHAQVRRAIAETPGRPAVSFEGRTFSYAELGARSARLAHALRRRGVGAGSRVAILVERSLDMVAAILAALDAGAAYVPLDPAQPAERLTGLLVRAGCRAAIGVAALADRLPGGTAGLWLDADAAEIDGGSPVPPEVSLSPLDLAYILFTSGSTGEPKGVMVSHGAIANRVLWATEELALGAGDRLLHKTPYTFDASIWEIFAPLAAGAELIVARPGGHQDPAYLAATIADLEVTAVQFVPSMMEVVSAEPGLRSWRSLRWLCLGGEALPADLRDRIFEILPRVSLVNLYGPTEVAIDATYHLCSREEKRRFVPLGAPIPNVEVHLADGRLEPVAIGEPGEVVVGGAGLARGYLGDPAATAAAFVPDPWSGRPGARLYRTGDRARWRPDGGGLEFLGRRDAQVKLRGFRIELGEVEAALARHPDVLSAVAVLRDDLAGGSQLVAYAVPAADASPSTATLREHLRRSLAEYMVPSAVVVLAELPRLASGKVDRRALPAPDLGRRGGEAAGEPRDVVEQLLAAIWCDLLGLEQVGIREGFFDLGGHSLLATQLVARVRDSFRIEIALRQVFEMPTIADLAAWIKRVERDGAGQGAPRPPVGRMPRDLDLPLSFGQQRLWFIDQLDPGSSAYNIFTGVRLVGALQPAVLARAATEVVRRHEALRTRFPARAGKARQEILPPSPVPLPLIDLGGIGARKAEADRLATEESSRPYALDRGPLVRFFLIRLGAEEHLAGIGMHHIVSDGWSAGVLIGEAVALYEAFRDRRPSPLPELPIQYADFAIWQRSWLSGAELDRQVAFWRTRLAGATDLLALATDRPRGAVAAPAAAVRLRRFPPALAAGLAAFSRRRDATLFMALLSALQTELHLLSGQGDVVVGTPIANRNDTAIEPLIGFFVNTLALRADLDPDFSFADVVAQARDRSLEAHAHQDVPFEKLVDELAIERRLDRTPLFQVLFAHELPRRREVELPGLVVAPLEAGRRDAKYDLTFVATGDASGLACAVEYRTALFDAATAERLLAHLETTLLAALEAPDRPIRALELASGAERQQVLRDWNPAWTSPGGEGRLHRRFASWARRAPELPALTFEGRTWNYGELDRAANRLAHRLRSAGVGPEVRVALCLDRTPELVISILATLKAGGCYVPLDPALPAERLAWIVEDTGAPVAIARDEIAGWLAGVALLRPEADEASIEAELASDPEVDVPATAAAYVIYTSGSTGRPKGVVVSHANVIPLFDATAPSFGFGPDDVWTLFHSAAFDFSVWEIWGALLYGGRLVVVPRLVSRSPEAFYQLLVRERVTVLNQTPSAFRLLIRQEETQSEPADLALRLVIFGGEALEPTMLAPWFARHGDRRPLLVNMYGITETTVHVTERPLRSADSAAPASLIGRPVGSLAIRLVDAAGRLAPIGVTGEIRVGGAGVARGYLGRPDLTAERFVPDPWGTEPGARLYRSGDLARWRADGDLEYLGRADFQVKVRGFRIELGEIESVLAAHAGVREAVVIAREDSPGDRRLVAYWIAASPGGGAGPELRDHLRGRLPDHMVPAAFVEVSDWPLTANGKLDRRALPAPGDQRPDVARYVAPRTEEEEILAGVWCQVLGLSEVGAEDGFFALGGDSIQSIQVVALARERGLSLSLQQLFQHQRLEDLARAAARTLPADERRAPAAPFALVAPEDREKLPADLEDAYPLTMLQAGMLFHMQLAPQEPPYHNVDSIHLRAPLDLDLLGRAVDRVVERHPVLRTSFRLSGLAEPLQLVHREAKLAIGVADLRQAEPEDQEREIDAFIRAEKLRLFDFAQAPQLRFFIHRRTEETFQFTLTENHAILDGWSLHSTLGEIFELYLALREGRDPAAAARPAFLFRDYVAFEREALSSAEQAEWWARRLAGANVSQVMPWAAPPPHPSSTRLKIRPVPLGTEVSAGLKRLARRAAVPLKSVLLAAHLKALARLDGREDVTTGVTFHGRSEDADGADTRGLFLNTLPVRFALPPGTWWELAAATFACEREIMPYRRYPAAALQKLTAGAALFEVAFNYVHFHVVEDLVRSGPIEVIDFKRAEGTNFALLVGFSQDLMTSQVGLQLEVDGLRFSEPQIAAVAATYARVLAAMATSPERRHDADPLLAAAERQQLVCEWNDTAWPTPGGGRCLHDLIAAQVERTPGAPALIFGDRMLSYRELDVAANRLAHRLRREGVAPGAVVGVAAERSPELVISLLAVLKAGAAYLPLEPSYPPSRLALLIAQADVPAVLTLARLADRLPSEGVLVLAVDALEDELAAERPEAPESGATPEDLAYVIYTSGSTGQPKGVMNSHRGIVNRLAWMQDAYRLGADDRVLQKTPFSFDVSVWEFFWPLLAGATLVVAEAEAHRDPAAIARSIAAQGVTTLHFVPSMLQLFLDEPTIREATSLRRVICSGEALPFELRERFFERLPASVELHNLYGPTEAAVDVTFWNCRREAPAHVLPIGRPIANLSIHLVDAHGDPAPFGTPGELVIGGVGLARGYLGAPALTAERFVPDPCSDIPGARWYRTGDLARFLPDGAVEFLGRLDHQVKVRGFRIELGEIEAAIASHESVREAVVVLDRSAGRERLVAYLVGVDGREPEIADLRSELRQKLPEYMVPVRFIPLAAMPLNANGKLDRKALPAPGEERGDLAKPYVEPRDAAERALAAIWTKVLGVSRVGLDDSFFELGGDSIRSIQVVGEARAIGLGFSVAQLLEHPSVRELAPRIEWRVPEGDQSPLSAPFSLIGEADREKLPEEVEDAYPLAALQAGMLFHSELEPETAIYHDVVTYHLALPFDLAAIRDVLAESALRHAVLRTSFALTGYSEPLQLVYRTLDPPLAADDLSGLDDAAQQAAIDAWIAEETLSRFAWHRPPLWRVQLHTRGAESFQFSFSFHHAILDGWSLATLMTEIFQAYLARLGRGALAPAPAPPPAVTFRDFVALERAATESEEGAGFWSQRLAGAEPTFLPRWQPPAKGPARIDRRAVPIPRQVSQALKRLASAAAVPVKSVLLAAHLKALAFVTGRRSVVTGLVFNGRPEGEGAERLAGLFLNTLPLRFEVGEGSWEETARAALQAEAAMTLWRRFPYAEIQRRFGGGRPLFETAFNYTHFHVLEAAREAGGIDVLGSSGFEQTNFTLLAAFRLNLATSEVELDLHVDLAQLPEAQVAALVGYYAAALAAMAQDGAASAAAGLLGQEESERLAAWGDARTGADLSLGLAELFAAQVERSPAAACLVSDQETVNYGELDRRSNRLAERLRRHGAGPERPVVLALERSVGWIVATLATVKAGAFYVPIDPALPEERLALLLAELEAPLVVTEERFAGSFPVPIDRTILLDREPAEEAEGPAGAERFARVAPDTLAYVMFTSGSTGGPKGVAVPQRAVVRLVLSPNFARLGPEVCFLALAPASFDASTLEIWGPLAHGGRLAIPPAGPLSPDEIGAAVGRFGVTALWLTAGLFQQIVDAGVERLLSLDQLLSGGDVLSVPHVERTLERLPGTTLVNGYGPTENTTFTACFPMRGARRFAGSVPIGRPVSETYVRVLGPEGQPAPLGTPGELAIGGAGLARGYLGRPDLTAERFVPDPDGAPGARLYRSGDAVRWRPEGTLEFLGRLDRQVKIRGFRIEPAEIEAALADVPEIQAAAVVLREDVPGDKRLVAYLVAHPGVEPSVGDLRSRLRARLPDYMVPSFFVVLPELPLNANGKVDRKRLPAPEGERSQIAAPFVAPRTPAEEVVASVLREVLRVERIGVDDDFFELGGHSLLATRAAARLADAFQVELPLRDLFEHPTVAGLAGRLALLLGGAEIADAVAVVYGQVQGLSDEDVQALLAG